LKLDKLVKLRQAVVGRPFAGAWIETERGLDSESQWVSRPFAGAWIETLGMMFEAASFAGRPFAGAWIETSATDRRPGTPDSGRPFAGAWIETPRRCLCDGADLESPLRGGVD